ncbi:NAD(P)H-binding protein [Kushneria aurantia]|uniref:NAD(P)H-binding protein n=1 Tax=Kushneria aurantia TaxID=504092 RepID=A0ABV6FZ84_9GAMM|nr:NAD(P)H-binding protein [Kushneria aurantia]
MIIVTGASGKLGSRIVHRLLARTSPDRIGVSVRDPDQLSDLAARGVRVRYGDFNDAASLRSAFEGGERILLVSSNAAASGGDPLAQHRTAIDVAAEIGVERLFYTSQMSAAPDSHFFPGRTHAATEDMLAASGLAWTSMRHGYYAESALAMNRAAGFESGVLAAPRDGKVAWTTHDDLAEADATLLLGEETIDGPTEVLTGDETLDLTDLARLISEIEGRSVRREVIEDDAFRANARERGMPDGAVAFIMGYYLAARAGEFAATSPLLERLIGRKPQTMRDVLAGRAEQA